MPASESPASSSSPAPVARRLAVILGPTFVLALLSFALPDAPIPLDGPLGDIWVRVADSGNWTFLPVICVATVVMVVSRPGLSGRRRGLEATSILAAMLVVLVGNALLNEHVIKPSFAVPRPNIEGLTEAGVLGPEIQAPAEFYALGDKSDRSAFLAPRLAELDEPPLSDLVRAHWAHETGYSFPSGHSTAAMTFASMMAALGLLWLGGWRQRVTSVVIPVWAVCVVYSRPLLQVHTALDVSVGTLVGFGWGVLAFVAIRGVVGRFGGS